jgi:hypothetical protein
MTISAAALVTLWGDELPEVGRARLGNTQMPGRDEKASTKDLAAAALALTVWDLWSRGELGVAFERKKRLGVLATAKVTIQATAQSTSPLAAALTAAVTQPRSLTTALLGALGGEKIDPAGTVLSIIQGELVALGILINDGSSTTASLAKAMVGRSSVLAVSSGIEAQRPAWLDLKGRWTAWQQANPEDAALLVKQARSALAFASDSTN